MRKIFFVTLLSVISLVASAESLIGVVDSKKVFDAMPDKEVIDKKLQVIQASYQTEISKIEDEYQNKVATFLADKDRLSANIQELRMQEIDQLQQRVQRMRKVAADDYDAQQEQLTRQLRDRIAQAITYVGRNQHLTCVLDLSSPTVLYFDAEQTLDITQSVLDELLVK